jgi:hypothetical protein
MKLPRIERPEGFLCVSTEKVIALRAGIEARRNHFHAPGSAPAAVYSPSITDLSGTMAASTVLRVAKVGHPPAQGLAVAVAGGIALVSEYRKDVGVRQRLPSLTAPTSRRRAVTP